MRDRAATLAPVAVVAGTVGVCCGLPILLSLGVVGAVAGWSVHSWVLVSIGLAFAAVGSIRYLSARPDTSREEVPHDEDL